MGWFTKKPKSWEILNAWFIPFAFISCGFFSFFSLLYAGFRVKRFKWIFWGIISAVVMATAATVVIRGSHTVINMMATITFLINWLVSSIFSIIILGEYLERLALGRKSLSWFRSGTKPEKKLPEKKTAGTARGGEAFIESLHKWEKKFDSPDLKQSINRMIGTSRKFIQKDSGSGNLLFDRYADTIDRMLTKYDELEDSRLNVPEISDAMKKMEHTMLQISKAFENELIKMYQGDILDMEAESAAFLQSLRNKGLLEDSIETEQIS